MQLLLLFFIPLMVMSFAALILNKFSENRYRITWQEFSIQIGVVFFLTFILYAISHLHKTDDVEVWSGVVTSKNKERVSCRHSYACNPHRISCGKDCTTIAHDTCYEHSYDIDWNVYDSIGGVYTIARIDRRGLEMPPRWDYVRIGEPTATIRRFENYIKGSPSSLFNTFSDDLPKIPYPDGIYDYFHIDRFITEIPYEYSNSWNIKLQELNGRLGSLKQVNIIVYVTDKSEDYSHVLENVWLGGKKNDVIVVLGVDSTNYNFQWVRIISWTKEENLKIDLRNSLIAIGNLNNQEAILGTIENEVREKFIRMDMKEYEYLKYDIKLDNSELIIILIIGLVFSVGLTCYFYKNDI